MDIGILILHYNTPEMTDRLARTIPEAIVIDNGSTGDGSYKGENRCWKIDPISGKSQGFTKGWNLAIEHFKKSYPALWLMNSDIQISREAIGRIKNVMDREDIKILSPSFNSCWRQMKKAGSGLREVKFVEFTAPVIKTDLFDAIGLFDENITKGYTVDADFCWTAAQKGFKTYVDDDSSFIHLEHRTVKEIGQIATYSREATQEMQKVLRDKYGASWRQLLMGEPVRQTRPLPPRRPAMNYTPASHHSRVLNRPLRIVPGANLCCWDIINYLVGQFDPCRYLEIGSNNGACFKKIRASLKCSIDPCGTAEATCKMASDDAFNVMPPGERYDVVFIDGLHHCEQVLRDVLNSSRHLSENGFIVLHDCRPPEESATYRRTERERSESGSGPWYGDVYKAQMWLVKNFGNVVTINDERTGCGIIRGRINFELPKDEEVCGITWNEYRQNIDASLRLISWNEFAPETDKGIIKKPLPRTLPGRRPCAPPVRGVLGMRDERSGGIPGSPLKKAASTGLKIAVYTAIFDRYDDLKPLMPQSIPADFYHFTDNPRIIDNQWKICEAPVPGKNLNARLMNRWYKLFPDKIEVLNDYDITIYLDGNCSLRNAGFIDACVASLANGDMLLFRHPRRSCIYEEFAACRQFRKFDASGSDIVQEREYRKFYTSNNGLYWCGCLVRRKSDTLRRISEHWWEHLMKYTWRDQVSFPVVCHLDGFSPLTFKEPMSRYINCRLHNHEMLKRTGLKPWRKQ